MPEEWPGRPERGNHISGGSQQYPILADHIRTVNIGGETDPLDRTAGEPRRTVAAQWRDEAAHQGLFTTRPLTVR